MKLRIELFGKVLQFELTDPPPAPKPVPESNGCGSALIGFSAGSTKDKETWGRVPR